MDVERQLVSAVARTQSMQGVLSRSIEPHHFIQRQPNSLDPNPLPGEVYAWMVGHFRRFKAAPSQGLVLQRFPRFEFLDSADPLDVLVDVFVQQVKRRILIEGIRQLSGIADDPTKWGDAEVHAFAVASDLARAVPSSTVTRLSDSLNRLEMHKAAQAEGRAPGITLGTPDLDALTYGVGLGELLIWEGFLGGGKSTMSMIQSATEWLERDRTSLVISLEMQGEKMANRWDAAMAGFAYKALKFMEMRDVDYDKWARFAEKAHASRFEKDVIVVDDIFHCSSERIFTEVERWRPDFFIVDTVDEINAPSYLRSKWERSDYTARELKAVCRASKRPGVGIAQSGREAEEDGAQLSNVADSITINRKADLVVGLHCTPAMKRVGMVTLRMLKNRDGEGDGLEYTYKRDPASLTLRPWTGADAIPTKT
jgi:replicative DNA helicase